MFRFNSATSAADVPISGIVPNLPFPRFFRLQDDNTNLKVWHSHDGIHWPTALYTVSRTSFSAAPDQIGFYVQPGTSLPVGVRILSWETA
jgi:hypothetical protein